MKKIKVLLSALAMVAALAFVSCSGGSDGTSSPAEEKVVFDGNVDLTALAGYDATVGGVVKDFGGVADEYATVAEYTLSALGYTADSGFTKVAVLADVYNGETKYDLSSAWGARIMLTIGEAKEYNAGVADKTLAVSDASAKLLIQSKAEPVTKVVITAITFSK